MKQKVFIFIPGFYGSTLIEKSKKRLIWGDPKELFLRRSTLALPIDGIKIPGAMELHPHSVIPDMQILGGLVKEEAYNKTILFLKNQNPLDIIQVAWDWRREPLHGVQRLHQAVIRTQEKYPQAEIILFSHSYGSLVASYYLRYGVQDYEEAKEDWYGLKNFSKVILSSCPYYGLMAIFRNMHKGIKFGLNTRMQNALAFCTFESSYYLMPTTDYGIIRNSMGEKVSLDLYNPETWIKDKWGIFQENLNIKNHDNINLQNFLITNLQKAKRFHKLMSQDLQSYPQNKNQKILYLEGRGFKTLHEGVWLNHLKKKNVFIYYPQDFKKWKFKLINQTDLFADGDGTVPDFSLSIPKAFLKIGAEVYTDQLGHLDMLQSKKSQEKIKSFLDF